MPDELAKLELHERLDEIIKRLDEIDRKLDQLGTVKAGEFDSKPQTTDPIDQYIRT